MRLAPDNIDRIFTAMEKQISLRTAERVEIVVCGGTALAMLDLVARTTKDVDVLAWARDTGGLVELERIHGFPDWLEESALVVARDFGLPSGWFNSVPASQLDLGLPDGFESRLSKRQYGDQLTVYLTGRRDQIFFKLFAAVDRNDYHTQDLRALAPTEAELADAARWVVKQDVSDPFLMDLKDFLVRHGYATVASQL